MVRFSSKSMNNQGRSNDAPLVQRMLVPVLLLVVICFQGMILLDGNGPYGYAVTENVASYVSTSGAATDSAANEIASPTESTETPVVSSREARQKDFFPIAQKYGTDKILGAVNLEPCLANKDKCHFKDAVNPTCRVWGHFYHTLYNKWLGPMSLPSEPPFQLLEIGFHGGRGYDSYVEFLPNAEAHSLEFACRGDKVNGTWPADNFAGKNANYQQLRDNERLHCGDASKYEFLNEVWTNKMYRDGNAPPLKVVIDDGSHLTQHMAASLFFWFPRIEPGGVLVVEDVQPIKIANKFRTQVLPQMMKDLHYCGDPSFEDSVCFPTIQPLLASVHCEMHICVFERNREPAVRDLSRELSQVPAHALKATECFERHEAQS